MEDLSIWLQGGISDDESGCAYPLGDKKEHRNCGMPRLRGSSYCPQHHVLCHVPSGTTEEVRQLREVEALANAVGGRRGSNAGAPPRQFLKRLEHALRDFARPDRS